VLFVKLDYQTSVKWSLVTGSLQLGADEIHCWRANLDCGPSAFSALGAMLSLDEKSRANRFVFDSDRRRFIVARGILRELLSAYSGSSPADLRFCYGAQGKPALDPEDGEQPVHFNLSHSRNQAVYGFAQGRNLGIDVELITPEFATDDIAQSYFSPTEYAELSDLPSELRREAFFLYWTRKEAYVKAHGAGLHIPLDSFHISAIHGQVLELQGQHNSRWTLRSFQPAPRYIASVAGEGNDWRLRYFDWTPSSIAKNT
jgi:4'-phosphopantetheinyl transferase